MLENVLHGVYDVTPYIRWGNSEDDPSTMLDRVMWTIDATNNKPKEESRRNQTHEDAVEEKLRNLLE